MARPRSASGFYEIGLEQSAVMYPARQQARELLAPVYGWFAEGFDMARSERGQGAAGRAGVMRACGREKGCPKQQMKFENVYSARSRGVTGNKVKRYTPSRAIVGHFVSF
jgi:hypothetical protein